MLTKITMNTHPLLCSALSLIAVATSDSRPSLDYSRALAPQLIERRAVEDFTAADPESQEVDGPRVEASTMLAALAPAAPNLVVTGITHRAFVSLDNTCSVIFDVRVKNVGTSTAWSLSVGARGWGTPSISTCTGTWRAFNTTGSLAPGQSRTVSVYGPGYVGPKVYRGTYLSITGFADLHCSVAESNESDNSRAASIRVGF